MDRPSNADSFDHPFEEHDMIPNGPTDRCTEETLLYRKVKNNREYGRRMTAIMYVLFEIDDYNSAKQTTIDS